MTIRWQLKISCLHGLRNTFESSIKTNNMMSLKNILLLNGVSSGATGVLLLAFSRFFANLFLINSTMPFASIGIFLIVFAAFVIWVSMGNLNRRTVQLIITLDTIW